MKTKPFLVLLFLSLHCAAQQPDRFLFKHLGTNDGLSQSAVIAMEQDRMGRMWLGTRDGLNVYDGTAFKVYRTVPGDSSSISNSDILTIKEDSEGFVWVGTYNGLNRYDPVKDVFERFYHYNDVNSLSNNTVWSIEEMSNGEIWVGTSNGLSIYDKERDSFTNHYGTDDAAAAGKLPSSYVLSIKKTKNGAVWVGTSKGLSKAVPETGGTLRFHSFELQSSQEPPFVQTIAECGENSVCIGTKNVGLLKFDLISERYLSNFYPKDYPDVRAVAATEEGLYWVGTSKGVLVLDAKKVVKKLFYRPGQKNGLSQNYIKSIFRDKKGSIWIGSYYGGIDIWDISNTNFINYEESSVERPLGYKVVSSIVGDTNGTLYFGTEGGGVTILGANAAPPKFLNTENNPILPTNNVKALLLDKELLWVATFNGGVRIYNVKEQRFEAQFLPEPLRSKLSGLGVYAIKKGLGDDIWIGTFGAGLIRYDQRLKTHTVFQTTDAPEVSLSSNRIRSLMVDRAGNVWVGTQSGLNLLQRTDRGYAPHQVKRFFYDPDTGSGDDILTTFQGSNGVIWVGIRAKGLYRFNGKSFEKKHIGTTQKITSVQAILEGKKGGLWLSSNQGILKYDAQSEQFALYTEKDGLIGNEFNSGAAFTPDGIRFFFGGPEGVSSFNADRIATNTYLPKVILTGLTVKNQTVSPTDRTGVLTSSMPFTQQIRLEHDKANFSISFSIPNFISSKSNQYQYRMIGLDDNWNLTDQASASFTIQNPGDYVFEVKGANNDGLWHNEPTTLAITVKPAPWLSPWALFLYGLMALGIAYTLFSTVRSRTRLKHKLALEHMEMERNQDINDAKLRFFTNISHEFRTPLTLIVGPLQQLLLNYKGSRGVYQKLLVMESNAKQLLQLINRLMDFRKLDHGNHKLEAAEGNIVKFLEEIFLSFSEYAKNSGHKYRFVSEQEEILVYYDRIRLEQVFYNLLSNAFKYTPMGGAISVEVCQDNTFLYVAVKDTGPGISEEYKTRVFERFFEIPRDAPSEKIGVSGTGIGLAIAKNIVDLHKGSIVVEDNAGGGSVFKVGLPLGREHLAEDEIIQDFKFSDDLGLYGAPETPSAEQGKESQGLLLDKERDTVLVVEDNEPLRTFIKELLRERYNVIEAGNGKEALQKALKYLPNLIVSDVMMPEMVGTELCAKIKEHISTSHIPVVLLTSRTSLLYKFEGLENGADDYISKPFNVKEFTLRIKNLIDSSNRLKVKFSENHGIATEGMAISSLDEKLLKKAINIVEDNIANNQFDIMAFSMELGVSRTLLFTKIKAWTNATPNEFIQEIRMKRAMRLLEQGKMNIAEVSYQVGFKNPKYFSKCFQKKYGLSPSGYVKKFTDDVFNLN
ncbi:two-component regulator propeller domain-containing protein [Maribacter sp. 2307ULW6-5]|uniref:hybrid sensor histidine kinase/response regulator transcription factor n=1 Tax=Maribacter sp. 2307ULW6-5 TaxID=3386275 RepID=UPI0039BD0079